MFTNRWLHAIFLIDISLMRVWVLSVFSLVLFHQYLLGLVFMLSITALFRLVCGLIVDGLVFVSIVRMSSWWFVTQGRWVFKAAVVVAHVDGSVPLGVVMDLLVVIGHISVTPRQWVILLNVYDFHLQLIDSIVLEFNLFLPLYQLTAKSLDLEVHFGVEFPLMTEFLQQFLDHGFHFPLDWLIEFIVLEGLELFHWGLVVVRGISVRGIGVGLLGVFGAAL